MIPDNVKFGKILNAIEGKDFAVFTDIMQGSHIALISLNDEGDFVAIPVLYRNCNPENDFHPDMELLLDVKK